MNKEQEEISIEKIATVGAMTAEWSIRAKKR